VIRPIRVIRIRLSVALPLGSLPEFPGKNLLRAARQRQQIPALAGSGANVARVQAIF